MKTKSLKYAGAACCGVAATRQSAALSPQTSHRRFARRRYAGGIVLLLSFFILHSACCLRAEGQNYSVTSHTIAGGGGGSTNGQFTIAGTIGQHDASNAMTNAQYSVTGGFWVMPQAVQTPGAPTLAIVPATSGNATISWTPSTPGFVLQENLNLGTTNWVNSPSGATNPITVPATAVPGKFYRLFKP